jgi:hypothetical protein
MDWPVLFWILYTVALVASITAARRRRRDTNSTESGPDSSPVLTAAAHLSIHP